MATEISVDKKTIEEFLKDAQKEPFLIPEYQRQYSWEKEHVVTLFEDLTDFTERKMVLKNNESYFLGVIVYFENNGQREIIDGQQRITSLLLFLRAIYSKLNENIQKNAEEENFIKLIEPLIWKQDELTGEVYKNEILIDSKVVIAQDNDTFHRILKTAELDYKTKDRYSKNFIEFARLFDDYCKTKPMRVYNFINNILRHTIVLPIKADNQETALTIFSTLNDRGLSLNDADIFKAQIYNSIKNETDKADFIDKWKDLEQKANKNGEKMTGLFYNYMFYLRAGKDDKDTTTPQLRRYLSKDKYKFIKDKSLLSNLNEILRITSFSKNLRDINDETWKENVKIKQIFNLLNLIGNEWWKYPCIIYYLTHKNKKSFELDYLKFLRRLYVEIFMRYSIEHAINSLKFPILKLNIQILKSMKPKFEFKEISDDEKKILKDRIKNPHNNLRYSLVVFIAYLKQNELLPFDFELELEHIFPRKWDNNYLANTLGFTDEKVKECIWNIGNLTPLEKKLNIRAGNGYFSQKNKRISKI